MKLPTRLTVRRPVAEGYGALLTWGDDAGEDMYLQLAPTSSQPIKRSTAQPSNQMPQLQTSPEDFRPESGRLFSRSGFSGGEGLDRAHRANAQQDDPYRFWSSQHIRVVIPKPGDVEQFYLAADIETISGAGTPASPMPCMVADGRRLYWADGQDVKYSDNMLTASPTITSENPEAGGTPGTVVGLGCIGGVVYAAIASEGIHIRSTAGSWSHWSDLAATSMWCVKNRIIASVSNALYDAGSVATSTLLKTLASGVTWTDVCDAGHQILAAASDGKVYAFSDETGSLVLRGETPMRPGEVPYCLGFADGLLFIGAGEANAASGKIGRLYMGQASGNRIVGMRLIREWGTVASSSNHAPAGITVTRDEALISVLEDGGKQAVWSYLLPTAGVYQRMYYASGTARPSRAFDLDGRIILFTTGAAVLREKTVYAASGYLITPYADWYSAAQKAIVGLRIDSVAIPAAGAQIQLYYSTDPAAMLSASHASWTLADTLTFTGDQTLDDEIPLLEEVGRGVTMMVKLTRSTATTDTPTVRSVTARAFEDLAEVIFDLPVNVSDQIERPGKVPLQVPGRGAAMYETLREREGQPAQLELLRTGEKIKGRLEDVGIAQPVVTWRGGSMLVTSITVRGVKIA